MKTEKFVTLVFEYGGSPGIYTCPNVTGAQSIIVGASAQHDVELNFTNPDTNPPSVLVYITDSEGIPLWDASFTFLEICIGGDLVATGSGEVPVITTRSVFDALKNISLNAGESISLTAQGLVGTKIRVTFLEIVPFV